MICLRNWTNVTLRMSCTVGLQRKLFIDSEVPLWSTHAFSGVQEQEQEWLGSLARRQTARRTRDHFLSVDNALLSTSISFFVVLINAGANGYPLVRMQGAATRSAAARAKSWFILSQPFRDWTRLIGIAHSSSTVPAGHFWEPCLTSCMNRT